MVLAISVWESTMQRHVEPEALSRVSAYDWFGSLAFLPVGLAVWGPVAEAIGYGSALWLAFGLHVASVIPLLAVRDIRTLPALPSARERAAPAAAVGPSGPGPP
jgi:hypothetical protein